MEKDEAEEKTQIKVDLRESQDSGAGTSRIGGETKSLNIITKT